MEEQSPNLQSNIAGLEAMLNEYLVKKAPSLPSGLKDFIVMLTPWFAILSVIGLAYSVLAYFLVSMLSLGITMPYSNYPGYGMSGMYGIVFLVVSIIQIALLAMAINGLFNKQLKAWRLLFYSSLVSVVASVVTFSFGSILMSLIGAVISLYFLFQIRAYYK